MRGTEDMAIKELLTIKEFAEITGRSSQAIYKQLNTRLKPFVQLVDNKKMIERRALSEVFNMDPENAVDQISQSDLNIQTNLEETLYEILKVELMAKNEQIAALQAELAEERKHSREQADRIAVFADQAQKLQLAQMKPQITEDDVAISGPEIMPDKRGISDWVRRLFQKN